MKKLTTLGIVANRQKPEAAVVARSIMSAAIKKGIKIFLDEQTAVVVGDRASGQIRQMARKCELILVLGGDGTMLQVARHIQGTRVPILGVNLGGLGFLTAVSLEEMPEALHGILNGHFMTSPRSQIQVEVIRDEEVIFSSLALNEVVISRAEVLRTIRVDLQIDHEDFTTYSGDGLICATPTGSTAYSLSGGGPAIHPEADVFVITPVCPHALANRSIVLADRSHITARIQDQEYLINLTVDGQEQFAIQPTDRITLRKAREKIHLAKLVGYSFYRVLREKLKWRGSNIEVKK